MFYVYGLRLKGDSEYRYVGSTWDMETRLYHHFRDAEYDPYTRNARLKQWLNEHGPELIIMDLLEAVVEESSKRPTEQSWIAKLSKEEHRLFNMRMADTSTRTFADLPEEQRMKIITRYLDDFERDTNEPWLKEEMAEYFA